VYTTMRTTPNGVETHYALRDSHGTCLAWAEQVTFAGYRFESIHLPTWRSPEPNIPMYPGDRLRDAHALLKMFAAGASWHELTGQPTN